MARPTKRRCVCRMPTQLLFSPDPCPPEAAAVILTLDEYETIRLIDGEGLSQAQCSEQLGVARTTAQKIYESARRKLATVLVEGRPLRIEGGEYRLCDGRNQACGADRCCKHLNKKGESTMKKIAVTYENGAIFQHFGHTEQFKLYDIADGAVTAAQVVSTDGQGHGALAGFLLRQGVDTLICGGIGGGAQMALADAGITLYGGVSGEADAAVAALLAGNLSYQPDVRCTHHEEGHDHACGSHGGHSCGHGHCGG